MAPPRNNRPEEKNADAQNTDVSEQDVAQATVDGLQRNGARPDTQADEDDEA
jgi:hypothetical protein